MGSAYGRATQIISAMVNARATTDPADVNPPCVLLLPPDRTYDVGCGFVARWTAVALAPAALGPDRDSWQELDDLVDALVQVVPVNDAQLVAYTVNGTTFPAYLCHFEENV